MITVATHQKSYQEDKPVRPKATPRAMGLHGSYQLLENLNYLECRNLGCFSEDSEWPLRRCRTMEREEALDYHNACRAQARKIQARKI